MLQRWHSGHMESVFGKDLGMRGLNPHHPDQYQTRDALLSDNLLSLPWSPGYHQGTAYYLSTRYQNVVATLSITSFPSFPNMRPGNNPGASVNSHRLYTNLNFDRKDIKSLVKFAYEHNVSPNGTPDWQAREAYRNKTAELLNVIL